MKINYSTKELFKHLSIFKILNDKNKLNIFKISCLNNYRYLKSPNQKQTLALKRITKIRTIRELLPFEDIIEKNDFYITLNNLKDNNYLKNILDTNTFLHSCKYGEWETSVVLNIWLIRNNYCPFLRFAFDQWYNISLNKYRSSISSLIEFSTIYLYRLAPIKNQPNAHGIYFANGSHNSLFLTKKTQSIKKIPKSIGAKNFINDQEIKVTKLLFKSTLRDYLPNLIQYNTTTKIIERQYIKGKTGHELLASNFFNDNPDAVEDLKIFFRTYKEIRKKLNINLDIHPGNFVWSEEKQKWFFVDTGPIPHIGSDYFPLNSFENYFQKIWTERRWRIKKMPIRSVNLNY